MRPVLAKNHWFRGFQSWMEPRERQGLLLGVAVNMLGRASRNLAEHIVEGPREAAECGVGKGRQATWSILGNTEKRTWQGAGQQRREEPVLGAEWLSRGLHGLATLVLADASEGFQLCSGCTLPEAYWQKCSGSLVPMEFAHQPFYSLLLCSAESCTWLSVASLSPLLIWRCHHSYDLLPKHKSHLSKVQWSQSFGRWRF